MQPAKHTAVRGRITAQASNNELYAENSSQEGAIRGFHSWTNNRKQLNSKAQKHEEGQRV